MIYWTDVKKTLLRHCPIHDEGWSLREVVTYLNKEEHLSMWAIAALTNGKCGRTSLCLKMKELAKKANLRTSPGAS
jgi:hypothetical protein